MKKDNTRTYDPEYVRYEYEEKIAFGYEWHRLDNFDLKKVAKMAEIILASNPPAVAAQILCEANILVDGFNAIVPRKDEDRMYYYPIKFGYIVGKHIVHDYDNLKW